MQKEALKPFMKQREQWFDLDENLREDFIEAIRDSGKKWTSKYVEKFGMPLNPWFNNSTSMEEQESFYRMCVSTNKPWEEYVEVPDFKSVIL